MLTDCVCFRNNNGANAFDYFTRESDLVAEGALRNRVGLVPRVQLRLLHLHAPRVRQRTLLHKGEQFCLEYVCVFSLPPDIYTLPNVTPPLSPSLPSSDHVGRDGRHAACLISVLSLANVGIVAGWQRRGI